MRRGCFWSIAGLLLCVSCAPRVSTSRAAAGDEQAINAVREREIRGLSAGAVDTALSAFSADVVMMPPNQPMLTGAPALRNWLQDMATQVSVSGRYTDADVIVAGDWGIERYTGTLRFTPKAGGPSVEERLKGIHIYRRQPDGSWRITHDVWNADAPPPSAAPQFTAADEAEVRALFDAAVARVRARDWNAWANAFSETAAFHPMNAKARQGRSAIRAFGESFPPIERFNFWDVRVWGEGNLAYGTSAVEIKVRNAPPDTGKQLVVFRRSPGNRWEAVAASVNSDLVPAARP